MTRDGDYTVLEEDRGGGPSPQDRRARMGVGCEGNSGHVRSLVFQSDRSVSEVTVGLEVLRVTERCRRKS